MRQPLKTKNLKLLPLLIALVCHSVAMGQEAAEALAMRVLGPSSTHFVFKTMAGQSDAPDQFVIYQHESKVYIEGNNDISLCTGLNYYLRHIAKCYISCYIDDPVQLPKTFPIITDTIKARAITPTRYYLTPSDFAITMRWWWWPQWERMIDWMALNGVNSPLLLSPGDMSPIEDKRRNRLHSWIKEREEELGMTPLETSTAQTSTDKTDTPVALSREFALETAWRVADNRLDISQWITDWCNARHGTDDPNAHQMWQLLLDSVMPRQAISLAATQLALNPVPNTHWRTTMSPACASHLNTVWLGLAMCTSSKRDSYYYDLTTLAALWLAQCFDEAVVKYNIALQYRDTLSMHREQTTAILILGDIERLLATHSQHLAGHQIALARNWGSNRDDRAYYEQLASQILIAEPQYQLAAGMVKERLLPRWQLYFDRAFAAACKGRDLDSADLRRRLDLTDSLWVSARKPLATLPSGDPRNVLTSIIAKSFPVYFHNAEQLSTYMERFPRSQLIDVYKLCFQDHFGPQHLAASGSRPDSSACAAAIRSEAEQIPPRDTTPAYMYTVPYGNYVRVNLRLVRDGVLPLSTLTSALLQSMTATGNMDLWQSQWKQLLVDMPHVIIRPANYAADSMAIASMLRDGNYVAHHSQQFNRAYNYHYRLIRADIFEKQLRPLIK